MAKHPRFLDRTGLDEDFFEPYKIAHHAVEAPVEQVSSALVKPGQFFTLKSGQRLRLERDVFRQASGEDLPLTILFQLQGQNWTQIAADIRSVRGLQLGKFLSCELKTRCVCIEVTDDAYQSHALFDTLWKTLTLMEKINYDHIIR